MPRVRIEPCKEIYRWSTIYKLTCAHSKTVDVNVGTLSGGAGRSSSGRTLFTGYNLSPRKHYSSVQGRSVIRYYSDEYIKFCDFHSFIHYTDSPLSLDVLQFAKLKLKKQSHRIAWLKSNEIFVVIAFPLSTLFVRASFLINSTQCWLSDVI